MATPTTQAAITTPWGDLLKTELIGFLEGVKHAAESAGNFAQEQIPQVINEILRFYATKEALSFFFFLLFPLFFLAISRMCKGERNAAIEFNKGLFEDQNRRHQYQYLKKDSEIWYVWQWITAGFTIVSLVMPGIHLFRFLKIIIAPRLFILEYIKNLL